jgi:hypothetical protein
MYEQFFAVGSIVTPCTEEIQNLSMFGEPLMALPQRGRLFKGTKLSALEQHESRHWTAVHHSVPEAALVVGKILQMQ